MNKYFNELILKIYINILKSYILFNQLSLLSLKFYFNPRKKNKKFTNVERFYEKSLHKNVITISKLFFVFYLFFYIFLSINVLLFLIQSLSLTHIPLCSLEICISSTYTLPRPETVKIICCSCGSINWTMKFSIIFVLNKNHLKYSDNFSIVFLTHY